MISHFLLLKKRYKKGSHQTVDVQADLTSVICKCQRQFLSNHGSCNFKPHFRPAELVYIVLSKIQSNLVNSKYLVNSEA